MVSAEENKEAIEKLLEELEKLKVSKVKLPAKPPGV
jgi:hypothetical protein